MSGGTLVGHTDSAVRDAAMALQRAPLSRKYVVLATDSAPTYAVWAPVAVRIWAKLGYAAILFVNEAPDDWHAKLNQAILDEVWRTVGTYVGVVPRTGHLTVANTMRCARLVGAACAIVQPQDFLLAADVDMIPLQSGFFQRTEPWVVLRALYQAWLSAKGHVPVIDTWALRAGEFRFPMCYPGATAALWRELFPEIIVGNPRGSLAALVEGRPDAVDLDESLLSYRWLASPRVADADLEVIDPAGVWRKGELTLVDPIDLPCLSEYDTMPRGLLRLHDRWTPASGAPKPEEAIDFIPHRFADGAQPFGCFDTIAAYWPDEKPWLDEYRAIVEPLLP